MLGDRARQINTDVTILNSINKSLQARSLINLNSIPLRETDLTPASDPDLRFTDFFYSLKYKPSYKNSRQDQPFLIYSDLIVERKKYVRFGTIKELEERAKTDKEIAFILKWCDLTEERLEQARSCIQLDLPLPFDILVYEKYLKDIVEKETGVRPEGTMLRPQTVEECERVRVQVYVNGKKIQDSPAMRKLVKEAKGYANN